MKKFAIALLLSMGLAVPALANTTTTAKTTTTNSGQEEAAAPAPTHYDFEDDQVEGDLQRPDGFLVSAIPKASQKSLIEIRRSFLPELVKTFENL